MNVWLPADFAVAANNEHRVLCVDGLLWWAMGSGWLASAAVMLATFASSPMFGPCLSFTAHLTVWGCYQVWWSDLLYNWMLLRIAGVVSALATAQLKQPLDSHAYQLVLQLMLLCCHHKQAVLLSPVNHWARYGAWVRNLAVQV